MKGSPKSKNRLKSIFFLYIIILMLSTFPMYTTNVSAILDGDWYLCNFQDHPLDTKDFIESIGGEQWLSVDGMSTVFGRGTGVSDENGGSGDYDYCIANWYAPSSNYVNDVYFNLSEQTTQISYNFDAESSQTATWIVNHYFRRANGDQVLKIICRDPSDSGTSQCDWYVYDSDDALKGSFDGDIAGHFWVNVTLNLTTSEINVNISKNPSSVQVDVWFSASNFDYISSIFLDVGGFTHYTWELFVDDFKINMSGDTPSQLWDIDQVSSGCANCEYDDYFNHSFASTDTIVDETNFNVWTSGHQVFQVALGVHSSSDLGDTTTWLRIGDDYNEERTRYYTYGSDYYILVWENVNLTYIGDSLPLEFKYINTDTSDYIYPFYINSDHDLDGDIQYKYSNDGDNYNGIYDGDYTIGRDLCYEIWYGMGNIGGDLNISVYNESTPTQAIENWTVTIYNKISGFIYVNLTNQTNPTVINATDYGLHEIYILIEAEGYYSRTYYADVENNVNYTLDAYLPPIDGSQTYCLQVLSVPNEYGTQEPIYNARIKITKWIYGVGLVNISELFTGYNGIAYVSLIVGDTYTFNVSKEGYHTEYQTITTSPLVECYTFVLTTDTEPPEYTNETVYHECINWTGWVSGTNYYMTWRDLCNGLIDARFVVNEINQSTGNITPIYWFNNTIYSEYNFTFPINLSNDYKINLYLNHSIFGYVYDMRYYFHEERNITSRSDFDTRFNIFGNNPFTWSAFFGLFVFIACLFSFGQENTGAGLVITGVIMLGINSLGITVLGVTICVVIIILGVLVQARRERRKQ